MKKFLLLMVSAILLFSLAACSSDSTSGDGDDVIKIGGIFSASGSSAPLGKPEMDTIKMLVEQINEKGGIDGKKIELIAYDDKSDQNEALLSTRKLIEQDKVTAIIGGTISGNSLAMIPIIEEAKIPYLSLAASKQVVFPDDKSSRHWTFKTAQGDDVVIPKVLSYLKEKGLTKVAWLNVANPYGTSGLAEFEANAAKYGVEAIIKEEFEATVTDAKAMLTRVQRANPQAIIVWGTTQESAIVTKNIREIGIDVPVINSHGIGSPEFIELAGDAANGVLFPAGRLLVVDELPDSDPQKETLVQYKKDFESKYSYNASTFGGHCWDAVQILFKALENAGTDKEKIRDYIENNIKDFVGISGIFNMSKENHNGLDSDSLVMVEIKDGKWTLGE